MSALGERCEPGASRQLPRAVVAIDSSVQRCASVPRPRISWAVAASLAAGWIHFANGAASSPARIEALVPLAKDDICAERRSTETSTTSRRHLRASRGGIRGGQTHQNIFSPQIRPRSDDRRGIATSATGLAPGETAESRSPPGDVQSQHGFDFVQKDVNSSQSKSSLSDLNKTYDINALMKHPVLLDNVKAPRHPIVLCHGLYGFDVRGPFWGLEIHYWANTLDILRNKIGAEVIVRGVPGTGAIADRALALHNYLKSAEGGVRGAPLNFIGHSMGGLDVRYLISVIKPAPEEYIPVSLTTLNAPHRGSPFMDWCNANVGTGNERVEAEIREVRARQMQRKSTEGALSARGPSGIQNPSRSDSEEDFAKHVVEKPPFSLKTPLFVRPTKPGQGDEDKVVSTANGTAKDAAAAQSATHSGKNTEKTKNGKGSSLLDFSTFKRALSSISGLFSSYMLSILDQPAYAMLSTRYMAYAFNPTVPDSPNVAYFSIASRKRSLPIFHPLWLPKQILDAAAESRSLGGERDGSGDAVGGRLEGNDGLVSVESAKWGTFLGVVENCDHWDLRGSGAPRWASKAGNANVKKEEAVTSNGEENQDEKVDNKEKQSSWADINRIIGKSLLRRSQRDKEKSGEAQTKMGKLASEAPSTSLETGKNDALVDEVANWISDRLPQRDADKVSKMLADSSGQTKQTGHQTATHSNDSAPKSRDESIASSPASSAGQDARNEANNSSRQSTRHAHVPSAQELSSIQTHIKLRREAAWEEELGHDQRARELRRELDWDSYMKRRDGTEAKAKSADELERFWIALCRHLWSHGY